MIVVAALAIAAAVLLWWGAPAAVLLDRLRTSADRPSSGRTDPGVSRLRRLVRILADRMGPAQVAVAFAVAVVGGLSVDGVDGVLRATLVVIGAVVAVRAAASREHRRESGRREAQWQEACEILAAELRGGRTAEQALGAAAGSCPGLGPVVRTMDLGGDVVGALRALAHESPAAAGLAAAWATAQASGAGLAGVVERVAGELTEHLSMRREIDAELASPRATARLLALLPLGGMGLGVFLGVDPLAMLLGTTTGLVCLLIGSVLTVVGVEWVDRLARDAGAVV